MTLKLDRFRPAVQTLARLALGWHLAYLGVWALTSNWTFSWYGRFHGAHWLCGGFFRALADSAALGVLDIAFAWGLLVSGVLILFNRFVRPACVFGMAYFLLMYILNPPHFGHTGESHFLFIDRNLIEVAFLAFIFALRRGERSAS